MICSILQSNKAPPLSMAIASRRLDASLFTLSPFPDNLLLIMEVFRTMKMIINGKRVDAASGETVEVWNPATGEVLDTVPVATQADIEAALDAARQGQKVWAKVPMYERIAILKRFRALLERDALAVSTMLTRELGKPLTQSTSETACTLNIIDNFCECARTLGGETYVPNNFSHSTGGDLVMTVREPIGVVACILPFNYPIELFVQKVVPALLMGNAVVIKPATDTPLANIRMAELLLEAGVAPEAVQLVTGSGARIGKWLCESPKIDCISLTGSTAVGIETARTARPICTKSAWNSAATTRLSFLTTATSTRPWRKLSADALQIPARPAAPPSVLSSRTPSRKLLQKSWYRRSRSSS